MPNLETLEKPDTPTPSKLTSIPNRWRWPWLIAPLMGLSIVFHIALLFVPLPIPAPEEAAVEDDDESAAAAAALDILSLSDIAGPAPPAEPPPEQSPQPLTASPPDAVPPPPDPAQVPELPVADQLPEATGPEETPPENSFDPIRQQALLSQIEGINSEFDETQYFPLYAWNPTSDNSPAYLSSWESQRLNCFFSSIEGMTDQLAPRADRLKYLNLDYEFIINEDLPRIFSGQEIFQAPNGYCGEDFFVVNENGAPVGIYVSTIVVGEEDPPNNVILIFWVADPR